MIPRWIENETVRHDRVERVLAKLSTEPYFTAALTPAGLISLRNSSADAGCRAPTLTEVSDRIDCLRLPFFFSAETRLAFEQTRTNRPRVFRVFVVLHGMTTSRLSL